MGVIPIILSGGSGTRLWPLSRKERPKQFLRLGQSDTFFQATLKRCANPVFDSNPVIVAADDHRFLVAENLQEIGVPADILLEPMPRNSCAAVIAGCLHALHREKDPVVLVMAADHLVNNSAGFVKTIQTASVAAELGNLVTFGIKPDFPATGYGYISKEETEVSEGCFNVSAFVEKPDAETAFKYLAEGYLWNSGNFLFRAEVLLGEARKFVPGIVTAVERAYEASTMDLDFLRLDQAAFAAAQSISMDYAVMEKTDKAVVTLADHDWSDIGTWNSVWQVQKKTDHGNVVFGDAKVLDGDNNLVHSHDRLTTVVGLDDIAVVSTTDALLVTSRAEAERIKDLVNELENVGRAEAGASRKAYRPWGNYDVIDEGNNYKVKRLEIKPNGVLSLQKHNHRAEHWVVVEGNPEVTIGEKTVTYGPNQSVYIPKNTVHRLANFHNEPAVLIEVQTGDYLGEDDIVRLDDQYNRQKSGS